MAFWDDFWNNVGAPARWIGKNVPIIGVPAKITTNAAKRTWGLDKPSKVQQATAEWGALQRAYGAPIPGAKPTPPTGNNPVYYGDTGGSSLLGGGTTGGGGPSPEEIWAQQQAAEAAAAQARANAEGKARTRRENENTRALADQQFSLLDSFGRQRDTKLGNLDKALTDAEGTLLSSYGTAFKGLEGSAEDNDKSEADSSFDNITNAVRERGEILGEVAALGAGETDLLKAQLSALRNYSSNQSEVNRSFFDTLRSVKSSVGSLNSDTATSRSNLYSQRENDREAAWANYYNQKTDTWTQIANIENSNNNIDGEASEGYKKGYANAGSEAAAAAGSSYQRIVHAGLDKWEGKGDIEDRTLNSTNRAATVNLGGPQKRPEGATLRKW